MEANTVLDLPTKRIQTYNVGRSDDEPPKSCLKSYLRLRLENSFSLVPAVRSETVQSLDLQNGTSRPASSCHHSLCLS